MGKKTLYHPVSLNVIRGALEYNGYAVGRIRQASVNEVGKWATYELQILGVPRELWGAAPEVVVPSIQSCFASDIEVIGYRQEYEPLRHKTKLSCKIMTELMPDQDEQLFDNGGDTNGK